MIPEQNGGDVRVTSAPRASSAWRRIEEVLAGLSILLATALVFCAVLMRYVLNQPIQWSDITAIILIIWGVFFTSSTLIAEDGHIRADILVERLPWSVRRWVDLVGCNVMLIFTGAMAVYGIDFVLETRDTGLVTFAVGGMPAWIPPIILPLGMFLMSVRLVGRIALLWRSAEFPPSVSTGEVRERI